MKVKFTCCCLLFLCAPVCPPLAASQAQPEKIATLLREAQDAFNRADYAEAIRQYEQVVALRPDWAEVLSNLGVAYHFAGRPRDAVATLEKALKLKPGMAPANLLLAIDDIKLGQPNAAVGPLRSVLEKDPSNRDALLALASAYFGLRDFGQAVEAYRREVAVRPNDSDAWYGMGLAFEHLAEGSARSLHQAGAASSYNQRLRGEMLLEQQASIDAEEAFARALPSVPAGGTEGLHAGAGFARLQLGELSKGEEAFSAELRLHPESAEGKLGMAAVALERQDWASAAASLCAVADRDLGYFQTRLDFLLTLLKDSTASAAAQALPATAKPASCAAATDLLVKNITSPESERPADAAFATVNRPLRPADAATIKTARRAEQSGRFSECARLLEPYALTAAADALLAARCTTLSGHFFQGFQAVQGLVKRDPQNLPGLYWQAEAARKLAQASFQTAVTLNPQSWQGHLLLGDLFRQRKKWDPAISHYEESAHLKPDSPGPLLGLATIYWQTGRNPQGEAALQKALALDPQNPMANFVLGDILIREHRFDNAIPYLERHLAHPPGFLEAHGDLGKAYAALGRNKEAIAELNIATPTDRSGELHFQLHTLYTKEGQTELARQALAESERLRAQQREDQQRRLERSTGTEARPPSP